MEMQTDDPTQFPQPVQGLLVSERGPALINSVTGRVQQEIGSMIHSKLSRIGRVWADSLLLRALRFPASRLSAPLLQAFASAGIFLGSLVICAPLAQAQSIVAIVNGTPITNVDIEQRMKLLHVLHEAATKEAAVQSLIDDNLKLDETNKYKIKAGDAEIGSQISRAATKLKIAPEALLAALRAAGVTDIQIKDHFAAGFTFRALMQAYSKGIDASETQIREELAKEGGKAAAGTEYVVHQVVFTVPLPLSIEKINNRTHAAEQLRARFSDCATGLPLARGMDDVAVKEEIRRNTKQLTEAARQMLDKTPTGHLTPPQRSSEGVEMLAVCSKSASTDDTAVRAAISERLLSAQIDAEAEKKLKELRASAVIVKK
jgi:peptidyl-prolyl cis-trans isomerase SurA